jgi:hypothetical protein
MSTSRDSLIRELPCALLQDARDTKEVFAAFCAGQATPRPVESLSGGPHRRLDVSLTGLGDLGQDLLGGRVDGLEPRPVNGLHELTTDEQSV